MFFSNRRARNLVCEVVNSARYSLYHSNHLPFGLKKKNDENTFTQAILLVIWPSVLLQTAMYQEILCALCHAVAVVAARQAIYPSVFSKQLAVETSAR